MITSVPMEIFAAVLVSSANQREIFKKKLVPLCAPNTFQVQLGTLLTMPLGFNCTP